MDYLEFLAKKTRHMPPTGFSVDSLNGSLLFPFQQDIVRWALRRGKAAIFASTGLGKTAMQLTWANEIYRYTSKPVLIMAPLAVSYQTAEEGKKFGIDVTICRSQIDVVNGVNVTNYEKLSKFDPSGFAAIVLDESSILKSYNGKTRGQIIEAFRDTPYKLACTATPAPNDYMELGNHAEFLGAMSRSEMLATFFVHDGGDTAKWRLKGHAKDAFWRWVASWAVMIEKPSDLGYPDDDFILPPLRIHQVTVELKENWTDGLFIPQAVTLADQRKVKKMSLADRVAKAAEIANASDDQCLIWCQLNEESAALAKAVTGAIEVKGSDDPDHKEQALVGFGTGAIRRLVSKVSIAGFGMNYQNCHKMIFASIDHSFEGFFQAIRRSWRFGQKHPVDVYVITSEAEAPILANLERKEREFREMLNGMIAASKDIMRENVQGLGRDVATYRTDMAEGDGWKMYLGDAIEVLREIPDASIHYSIFSPPFASLYTYSNSERDLGNTKDMDDFMEHFGFLVPELYRVIMPGRLVSFHCMDIPAMKERDGYIGLKDFPGDLIRLFQSVGFIYHSKVVIWKDPLIEATRTKALGLLHKQIQKDSAMCRQGLPDYLVTMRKPGENKEPIAHPEGFTDFIGENEPSHEDPTYSHKVWRRYASPVWMDINQSDTLQYTSVREEADERHICPLQLGVIGRAIKLWTNPGDTVLSPFAGIGSEGYQALKMGRQFVGIELKEVYWRQAVANLNMANDEQKQISLYDLLEQESEELLSLRRSAIVAPTK